MSKSRLNKSNHNDQNNVSNSNYLSDQQSISNTHVINQHGVPVPSIKHIQEVLGNVTSVEEMEGKDNVLGKLFEKTINSLLQGEIENHLGYSSNQKTGIAKSTGNSRNGYNFKKLKSGEIEVNSPRDRLGKFKPKIVEKNQTSTMSHQTSD